ncbi:hypothetical protein FRC12_025153 [Ceratobasidium sp. 428]|nr:hypothetical protein FRC12_025153 [Ceratobasidium sp. 428]
MIHPGELELHIRLGIKFIGDEPVPHAAQLLLARSNVVSLVLSRIGCDSAPDIKLFFLDVPRLRALRVDLSDRDVDAFLSALADCYVVEYLPSLQLLCLSNGEVNSRYMSRIKRMVEARRLRSLLFWSCGFPAFFNDQGGDAQHQVGFIDFGAIADADEAQPQPQPQPQAPAPAPAQDLDLNLDLDLDLNLGIDQFEDDDDDAGILGSESETPNTYSYMPTRTEEWLLGRVNKLVVCEAPLDRIINGVDVLAQEMAKVNPE